MPDLWVTQGEFALKNAKLGREICIWLKIDFLETKFACGKYKLMSNMCAKEFSELNFD